MISDSSKPRQEEKKIEKSAAKEQGGDSKDKVIMVKIAQVEPSRNSRETI